MYWNFTTSGEKGRSRKNCQMCETGIMILFLGALSTFNFMTGGVLRVSERGIFKGPSSSTNDHYPHDNDDDDDDDDDACRSEGNWMSRT